MLARRPSAPGEISLARSERFVLEGRPHRVVPAIEEAESRDYADDFDDLLLRPMLAHLHKHVVSDGVGYGAGGNGEVEGRALRVGVKRACLILPNGRELGLVHPEMHRAAGRMRHAVLTSGCAARDVSDKPLETSVDLAVRIPHGCQHLRPSLHHFGLALHDQEAVRNKAQRFLRCLELLAESRVRRQRKNPRRGRGTLVHGLISADTRSDEYQKPFWLDILYRSLQYVNQSVLRLIALFCR